MLLSKKEQEKVLNPYMENPKKYQEEFTKKHGGDTNFESDLFNYWLNVKLLIEFTENNRNGRSKD